MNHIRVLLAFVVLQLTTVHAQPTIEIKQGERLFIGKSLQYFVDESNAITTSQVKSQEFLSTDNDILSLGNTPNTVWLRFSVKSPSEQQVFVEFAAPLMEELELYEVRGDSLVRLFSGGFEQPFANRPIISENWLFSVDTDTSAKIIYVKGRSGFPFQVPITITAKDKFVESNQMHNLFWGVYMGVMLFALLYNFFIFLSVRERIYFYYILYIIGSVAFYLGLQGFSYMFLWPNQPGMNQYLPILICLTNIVITLFAFSFLQITRKHRVAFYWGWSLIVGFALIAVVNLVGPYPIAAGLAQMLSMVAAIYFIYAGVNGLVRKVPTARFYLLAWTLFLVFVIIFLLTINDVIVSNFFTTHCIFIGHMTEVLLLSFALADRINRLKEENARKQREIIKQLEENERIQLVANLELEQKVQDRTAEVVEQRNVAVMERERSDELLLNILPEETAEELKATGKANAKLINHVTVMFTDIKDFTRIAEGLSPHELVADINEIFSGFDKIIGKYNVEKIKTIGDSYMAVGGLPTPNDTHAVDIVNAAIEIEEFIRVLIEKKKNEGKEPLEIRLGIHTGPVVAGVVGVKKFAYDIWGNTVNIASRMENSGQIGKINISETTYELVKHKFVCTPRGKMEAKNMAPMEMFFVEGRK